jgi:hypothetical protein
MNFFDKLRACSNIAYVIGYFSKDESAGIKDCVLKLTATRDILRKEQTLCREDENNPWKEAIIQVCISHFLEWDPNDARKTLASLLQWERKCAKSQYNRKD